TQQQQTQQQQTAADTTGAAAATTEGLSCFLCLEGFLFFCFCLQKAKRGVSEKKTTKHPMVRLLITPSIHACMQLHANGMMHACNCMQMIRMHATACMQRY